MIDKYNINLLSRVSPVWRIAMVLVLIAIVLAEPVLSVVLENSDNKTELSSIDSDQEDQEDSEEEDSEEEDSEEKDKVEKSLIATPQLASLAFLSRISDIDHQPKHSSDFRIGIILPPPEQV